MASVQVKEVKVVRPFGNGEVMDLDDDWLLRMEDVRGEQWQRRISRIRNFV